MGLTERVDQWGIIKVLLSPPCERKTGTLLRVPVLVIPLMLIKSLGPRFPGKSPKHEPITARDCVVNVEAWGTGLVVMRLSVV